MTYNLKQILDDHADFVFTKLMIASSCVTEKQWTSIRGCLSSNYKFSVDTETFPGTLGRDVVILPAGQPLFTNSARVLELFVRYDFVNGQDAAICEMLMTTKKLGWAENFSSSVSQSITHRFAYRVSGTKLLGVISIENPTKDETLRTLTKQFETLYKYSIKTKTLNEYLTKLKEITNEQG